MYHRPLDLTEALHILANGGVRTLAGGTDIYPALPHRELSGETLDITAISDLRGIEQSKQGWRIGATTTWTDVLRAKLPPAFDALQAAAREVGSLQIQNSATVAGNLCNASPAADGVPPLLILDAEVEISSLHGTRRLPLADFLLGVRQIDLQNNELLTAIHIPQAAATGGSAFEKLGARKYLIISICMVAVRLEVSSGLIRKAAVSVGSCSPVARRLPVLENAMLGQSPDDPTTWERVLAAEVQNTLQPIDDIRADAKSRGSAAIELTRRVTGCAGQSAAKLDIR